MESTSSIKKVKVKTLSNQVYELEFDLSQPVGVFKQKIAEVSSVPVDRQRLVHMGKLLLDDQPLSTYVKGDDQTVHLMAKTESSSNSPPPPQAPTGPQANTMPQGAMPQQGNMAFNPFGINISSLIGDIGNMSQVLMRSIDPNQINNIMRAFIPQQPSPPGRPPAQQTPPPAQQQGAQSQPTQSAPPPTQQVPAPPPPPQPQSAPQVPPIPLIFQGGMPIRPPQPHVHIHQHPPMPQLQGPNPIVLPFNILYALGTMITQLYGENSAFPGPPLPQMGNRNNVQILGAYLSNWHFQMMRFLPFVYRLGEVLQREPALEEPLQREETNSLITRVAPILHQVVNATQPVLNLYRNLRLGPNPGQFSLNPQGQQPQQPQQVNIQVPPTNTEVPPVQAPQAPTQVTFSAVIEEEVDNDNPVSGPSASGPVHVIQQTTMTIPTGEFPEGTQQAQVGFPGLQLPFQFPFNILGMQFGVPPTQVPPQAPVPPPQPQPTSSQSTPPQQPSPQQPSPPAQSRPSVPNVPHVPPPAPTVPSAQSMNNQLQSALNQNPMISSLLTPENISMATSSTVRDILRDTESPDAEESIYSLMFGDIVTGELMSSFTMQNFAYLDARRQSIRKGLVAALNRYSGSKEALVAKIIEDLKKITASEEMVASSIEGFDCQAVAAEILSKHIQKWIALTLSEEGDYAQKTVKIGKAMIGELLYELSQGNQNGLRGVSESLRTSIIREYNSLMMGMAGLVFVLVQRFIFPLYNEYKADMEREAQRTAADHLNEEQLLARIQTTSSQDKNEIEESLKKPHSKHYSN